jgi:hypothetical protein
MKASQAYRVHKKMTSPYLADLVRNDVCAMQHPSYKKGDFLTIEAREKRKVNSQWRIAE